MSGEAHVLRVRAGADEQSELLAPSVGVFEPSVAVGQLVSAGQPVGTIDVLGVVRELRVPKGVAGRVVSRVGAGRNRVPVEYDEALVSVTAASVVGTDAAGPSPTGDTGAALAFEAPMSGRFYGRPSPTDPPFVSPGDEVHRGQTVGLLEVMKTFNRLVYQGDGLPDRAIVGRVVPADGDDVVRGDAILALRAPTEE